MSATYYTIRIEILRSMKNGADEVYRSAHGYMRALEVYCSAMVAELSSVLLNTLM